MNWEVWSPGTAGELIEGYFEGNEVMVTCPVSIFAKVKSGPDNLQIKGKKASVLASSFYGSAPLSLHVKSPLPEGKGMASSTADISAVIAATALSKRIYPSVRTISRLASRIEPGDSSFIPGNVLFQFKTGKILSICPSLPPFDILLFDEGGFINTQLFNRNRNVAQIRKRHEGQFKKILAEFMEGSFAGNLYLVGKAAAESAFLNQEILYKPHLEWIYREGKKYGSYGVVAAHSGTVMGLMINQSFPHETFIHSVNQKTGGNLKLMGRLSYYDGGMIIWKK